MCYLLLNIRETVHTLIPALFMSLLKHAKGDMLFDSVM